MARRDVTYVVSLLVTVPKTANVAQPGEWGWDNLLNDDDAGASKRTPVMLLDCTALPIKRSKLS